MAPSLKGATVATIAKSGLRNRMLVTLISIRIVAGHAAMSAE
jgi:hypothetical protein